MLSQLLFANCCMARKKKRHSPNYVSEVSYQNSSKSSFNHHLITMFARKLAHTTPNSTIMINYDLIVAQLVLRCIK